MALSTKSKRSAEDNVAPMGVGAADVPSRLACSIGGMAAVDPCFTAGMGIPNAGVLLPIPALLANGLIRRTDKHFLTTKRILWAMHPFSCGGLYVTRKN